MDEKAPPDHAQRKLPCGMGCDQLASIAASLLQDACRSLAASADHGCSAAAEQAVELIDACLHEAGHAVVALKIGWRVLGVQVQLGSQPGQPAPGYTVVVPQRGDYLGAACMALAGPLAEVLAGADYSSWVQDGLRSDLETAAKVVCSIGAGSDVWVAAISQRAADLVCTNRGAIARVGEAIWRRRNVDGATIERLCASQGQRAAGS